MKKESASQFASAEKSGATTSLADERLASEFVRLLFPGAMMSGELRAALEANGGKPVAAYAYELAGARRFALLAFAEGGKWRIFGAAQRADGPARERTIKFVLLHGLYQAPLKVVKLAKRGIRFVPKKAATGGGEVSIADDWTPFCTIKVSAGVDTTKAIGAALLRLGKHANRMKDPAGLAKKARKPASIDVPGDGRCRIDYVRADRKRGLRTWLRRVVPAAIRRPAGPLYVVNIQAIYYAFEGDTEAAQMLAHGLMCQRGGITRVGPQGEIRALISKGSSDVLA